MQPVLFFLSNHRNTLERYLLIANELSAIGLNSIFIDLYGQMASDFEKFHSIYAPNCPISYQSYPDIAAQVFENKPVTEKLIDSYSLDNFFSTKLKPISIGLKQSPLNLGELITDLGFNNINIVEKFLHRQTYVFHRQTLINHAIIDNNNPLCIFYDMELLLENRAMLYVASKRRITTFSLQHSEGFCEQYANLPLFADYYFSYSKYNSDVLKMMGVKENNIIITGKPELDHLFKTDILSIAKELSEKFNISANKKKILLSLKPSLPLYKEVNQKIIDNICEKYRNNMNVEIILKQHPTDIYIDIPFQYQLPKTSNVKIITKYYPISRLLKFCDIFFNPTSSCIVDAMLFDIQTIEIKHDDNGFWPDWYRFNAFKVVELKDLQKYLSVMDKNDTPGSITQKKRQEFIDYFNFKFDGKCSLRIAKAVKRICSSTSFVNSKGYEESSLN